MSALLLTASTAQAAPSRWGAFIDSYPGYEGQSKCDPAAKPGVLSFQAIVLAREPGTSPGSISRDCSVGGQSEHKEGRAWDWGASADVPSQRAAAERVVEWLAAPDAYGNDAAMARRFGIMYLIFNRRIWFPGGGWSVYCVQKAKGCVAPGTKSDVRDPHTSHVHFSFTWDGALKKTSYWHPRDSYAAAMAASPGGGYWVAGLAGGVISSGAADLGGFDERLNHPAAAIAPTPSGGGYWITTVKGHVAAFGDARFRGQLKSSHARIADIAPTPTGRGYWLVSAGGRVFPFGDAQRFGASRSESAGASVVSLLPSATGLGYTLVGADAALRPFGDALAVEAPKSAAGKSYVAAASSPLGGVWLATNEGEVVVAGGAPALADLSRKAPSSPVVDVAASAGGRGYYLLLENGTVRAFGDAR